MRTTLTLDEDVASLLARVRQARGLGLKQAVNQALRQGLQQMSAPPQRGAPFVTQPVDLGRCLLGDLDDIGEVLAIAEGEDYR